MIPYADFLVIHEELEDAACLRILRKAKAADSSSNNISLRNLKSRLPAMRTESVSYETKTNIYSKCASSPGSPPV